MTVSENARRLVMQKSGIRPERVTTIPNGIDAEEYSKDIDMRKMKDDIEVRSDARLISIVARLSPEKDHEMLLEAFSLFCKQFTDVDLVVVGDGGLFEDLKNTTRRLEVAPRVHFLGYRKDVAQLLATFDCFVLSSRSEGLSMTLLEAMAAGLPVVATDVGGNSEVVQHEETGFLVPTGEP